MQKHAKKCPKNPEVHEEPKEISINREEIESIVEALISKHVQALRDDINGISDTTRSYKQAIIDLASLWKEMRPALFKRWHECKGYTIVIKRIDETIEWLHNHAIAC